MIHAKNQENLIRSSQSTNLLAQYLRCLLKSENLLLSENAIEILQQAIQIEQRLNRIKSLTCNEG